ncbi:hypothetical protein [Kitasatospora sp. NPDC059571]|uniref:hypothetical protein n=1 Tax=Kitasatospora sp. NPDC059571 TaxID=3346871 RepID=UPI003679D295
MRRTAKTAAVAAIAAASILGTSGAAGAAEVSPRSYHSGTSGCFNWSWSDGNVSATVYYHNVCSSTQTIDIWWRTGSVRTLRAISVGADGHGSHKENGTVDSIQG